MLLYFSRNLTHILRSQSYGNLFRRSNLIACLSLTHILCILSKVAATATAAEYVLLCSFSSAFNGDRTTGSLRQNRRDRACVRAVDRSCDGRQHIQTFATQFIVRCSASMRTRAFHINCLMLIFFVYLCVCTTRRQNPRTDLQTNRYHIRNGLTPCSDETCFLDDTGEFVRVRMKCARAHIVDI